MTDKDDSDEQGSVNERPLGLQTDPAAPLEDSEQLVAESLLAGGLARIRRGSSRYGWGVLDQALSSITNFALLVFVAHATTAVGFGAFALAFGIYLLALSAEQALIGEPLTVLYSAKGGAEVRLALRRSIGAAAVLGAIIGLAIAACTVAVTSQVAQDVLFITAVGLPLLLVQDCCRFAGMTSGQRHVPITIDGMWALAQAAGFGWIHVAGIEKTAATLTAVWVLSAAVSALSGCVLLRVRPSLRVTGWWKDSGHLAGRFLVENVAVTGAAQVLLLFVGLQVGVADAGAMRAAQTLFGPMNVLLNTARIAVLPEVVRARQHNRELRLLLATGVVFTAAVAVWAVALLLIPDSVGEDILGASWRGARDLIPALSVQYIALAAGGGGFLGLRAYQAAGRSMRARVALAAMTLVVGGAAAAAFGVQGAVIVTSIVACIGAFVYWHQYLAARADSHTSVEGQEHAA